MKLAESYVAARERLAGAGVMDAALEAEVLHRHAMQTDRVRFFANLQEEVEATELHSLDSLLGRRLGGEPLPYITGEREFYGLAFFVDARVLVPRQETELLVDLALKAVARAKPDRPVIADAGTGSGAIAVALATHLPDAMVYATDMSEDALAVAARNCERHGVADKVRLLHGDLLAPLPEKVDIIVSNPPYIPSGQIETLPEDVRREPRMALDGGVDGLELVRRLLSQTSRQLQPGGTLVFELMPEQAEAAMGMARQAFPNAAVSFEKDLLGLPRAVVVG